MLSLYLGRGAKTDRIAMPGFVFVLDSRSGWQGEPPGGKIVVHAPREPNHARVLAAGEKLIEEVVLELVTEERRSNHRTGRPL